MKHEYKPKKCKARLERDYTGASLELGARGFLVFIYRKNADGSHKHIAVNIDAMTIENITGKV